MDCIDKFQKAVQERTDFRKRLTEYVSVLQSKSNPDKIKELSELRKIDVGTLSDCGIFYIDSMKQMLIPAYLEELNRFGVISPTNNMPIYNERWVIPIKDSDGLVQGLVGYTNQAHERYVYATTDYYMRGDTLWGLERTDRAYDLGYSILAEGIMDAIHIRSVGYEPVFASCGTRPSSLNMTMLNRPRYGMIRIPDRDEAGNKTKKHWVTNRYVTLVTPIQYKDSDETLREEENTEWFKQYMDACIDWLHEREHHGLQCESVTAVMM